MVLCGPLVRSSSQEISTSTVPSWIIWPLRNHFQPHSTVTSPKGPWLGLTGFSERVMALTWPGQWVKEIIEKVIKI